MAIIFLFFFLIILVLVSLLLYMRRSTSGKQSIPPSKIDTSPPPSNNIESPSSPETESFQYIQSAYQQKWMFTQNEKMVYYKLREIAAKHNLILFAKVRLFDLVTPIRNHPKYKTNLYKIQAKHVDFVFTKSNLVAKYVIELDDASHNTQTRQQRDTFVDSVLTACGYKVLHIRTINEEEISAFFRQ